MKGFWLGPMDPIAFLKSFMHIDKKIPERKLSKAEFQSVPTAADSEQEMYEPLAASIEKHKLLPKTTVFHTRIGATSEDKTTPDVVLRRSSATLASPEWNSIELCVVITPKTSQDAFTTSYDDTAAYLDDVTSSDAKSTQDRIVSYATSQFTRQHRVFAFSLLICGVNARFIRWDRAGAIVSKHFDYHERPRLLAEFMWRFGQLSPVQRGHDPTVCLATADEKDQLKAHIMAHIADPTKRKIPKMERSYDPTYPCYKIAVTGSGGVRHLIVQRPISSSPSPAGRCTRGYFALDLDSKELVFLKDYWRPKDSMRPSEAEVYAALTKASVPHLPHVRLAGDVADDASCKQSTTTERWGQLKGALKFDWDAIRGYQHHRVVQDVAYPLSSIRNSQELAAALRDVVQCMLVAHKHGWLHQDVSDGNVMLNEKGRGILNDWDHGIREDPKKPDVRRRSGTFQFLSVKLARAPYKPHELQDDLESCFWVLMYHALRQFKSNAQPLNFEMFDEHGRHVGGDLTGGNYKFYFIHEAGQNLVFNSNPLNEAVQQIRGRFRAYFYERMVQREEPTGETVSSIGPDILKILDDILFSTDWPQADVVQEPLSHVPPPSQPQPPSPTPTAEFCPVYVQAAHRSSGKRRTFEGREDDSVTRNGSSASKKAKTRPSPSPSLPHNDLDAPNQRSTRRAEKIFQRPVVDSSKRMTRSQTKWNLHPARACAKRRP